VLSHETRNDAHHSSFVFRGIPLTVHRSFLTVRLGRAFAALELAKVMRDRRQNKADQKGALSTALLSGYESLFRHLENKAPWW
jgi:hypothetical protein